MDGSYITICVEAVSYTHLVHEIVSYNSCFSISCVNFLTFSKICRYALLSITFFMHIILSLLYSLFNLITFSFNFLYILGIVLRYSIDVYKRQTFFCSSYSYPIYITICIICTINHSRLSCTRSSW